MSIEAEPELGPLANPHMTTPPANPQDVISSRIMASLLRMADNYYEENSLRQATEMYFSIMERAPDSQEANKAQDRLLMIAESYDAAGERRQARALLEKLL